MNPLEIQAWMAWIALPEPVVLSGFLLDSVGQKAKGFEEFLGQFGVHNSSKPFKCGLPALR